MALTRLSFLFFHSCVWVCAGTRKPFSVGKSFRLLSIYLLCLSFSSAGTRHSLSFIIFGSGVRAAHIIMQQSYRRSWRLQPEPDTWYLTQLRGFLTNVDTAAATHTDVEGWTLTSLVAITWYDIYCLPLCSHTWWECKHKQAKNFNSSV